MNYRLGIWSILKAIAGFRSVGSSRWGDVSHESYDDHEEFYNSILPQPGPGRSISFGVLSDNPAPGLFLGRGGLKYGDLPLWSTDCEDFSTLLCSIGAAGRVYGIDTYLARRWPRVFCGSNYCHLIRRRNMMKFACGLPIFLGLGTALSFSQGDTVTITAKDLIKTSYLSELLLMWSLREKQKTACDKPHVCGDQGGKNTYKDKSAVAITQRWDSDGASVHKAYTVFDARFLNAAPRYLLEAARLHFAFGFINKESFFEAPVPSESRDTTENDFSNSFKDYNLNWQSGQEPKAAPGRSLPGFDGAPSGRP